RLDGVAVHRVALPHDLVAGGGDLLHDGRQHIPYAPVAHPGDEGEPAGDVVRVELLAQLQRDLRGRVVAQLHPDRVGQPGDEVDVGAVELAGALAHPEEVAGQAVRPAADDPG